MKWVDRFAQRHRRFGIPNLMVYIVILNLVVYVLSIVPNGERVILGLYFNRDLIFQGQIWRLFTFLFIPESSGVLFLILTLYFYYLIGSSLEREWGSAKFTLYYLLGLLFTIAVGLIFDLTLTSAMYLNLSLFFAFASLYPDFQVLLFFFLPIKIKWLALIDAFFFLIGVVLNPWPYFLVPLVAVANYFLFFFQDYVSFFRQRHRTQQRASSFRRNVREGTRQKRDYIHKCSVCGITDKDDPNMEFRYCSLCTGYKCYCANHLFRHEHH